MSPRLLAEKAVRWGTKANPNDPKGADDALAVRATRYGCQMQDSHGPWSKAAYDLLHLRFPATVAAIRTRWWFDCKHFTYGCTESGKDDYGFSTGVERSSIVGTQMMRDDQTAAGVQR